jgi:hypothetical protein
MTDSVIEIPTRAQPRRRGPRRHPLLAKFCQCLGLASIILVLNYGDLLGGGADVRMHVPFRLTGIVFAQLADILLLGLVLFASFARLLLGIVLPVYIGYRNQTLIPFAAQAGLLPVFAAVWAALLLLLFFRFKLWYRRVMRLGDAIGIFLFVFAVCSVVQLLWVTLWRPGPYRQTAAWENAAEPPRVHPRLVWIVFDELSYDQLFEHRAHDLELPHFDALRSQSTLFTDVQPIGLKTVKIIPSLLSGHVVDDIRFHFDNRLSVHYVGMHGWHPLTGRQTIFAEAQQDGWRTAAVGWYNPYCTLYRDAIDNCYFMNLDRIDGLMSQRDSFWRNTYSPLQQIVREIKAPARADRDICTYDVRQRYQTHIDLEKHALETLHTGQADFTFLHLAVPHSPNIWSRINDDYTQFCDSSYLDNLALADRVLGRVLAELQASPRWNDTTLIVQGDHSWRIFLWDWLPAWTDEDDAASRNGFDPRPALLIHLAGQTQPHTVSTPWLLINLHRVIEEVLRGQPVHY